MKKSGRVFLLSIIVLLVFPVLQARAYNDDSTHYELTQEAVDFYSAYSGRVFSSQEREWVARGGVDEDFPPRWVNHFYDPIHNEPWLGRYAGNVDTGDYAIYAKLLTWQKSGEITPENFMKVIGPAFGISQTYTSKDWAQNEKAQAAYNRYKGNRTWQRALYEYTSGNKKEGLYTLGYILHLLEDATVPDHTRGDTHKENPISDDPGSPYEKWAERLTRSSDLTIAENLTAQNEKPIAVQNLDQVFDLLANFSNRNFFSEDTIGIKAFNEPQFTDDEKFLYHTKDKYKIAKYLVDRYSNIRTLSLYDDSIMREYWSRISPLAVKAGAGVMEYFFKEVERIEKEKEKLAKPQTAKFKMISPLGELSRLQQQAKTLAENIKNSASAARDKIISLAKQAQARLGQSGQSSDEQVQGKVLGESVNIVPEQQPLAAPAESVYRAALASSANRQILTSPSLIQTLSVVYQNTGNAVWPKNFSEGQVSLNAVGVGIASLAHPSWLTGVRPAAVDKDINPNEQAEFKFLLNTPSEPGDYALTLRPVVYRQGKFQFLGGPENQFRVAMTVVEDKKEEEQQIIEEQEGDSSEQIINKDNQSNEVSPPDLSDILPVNDSDSLPQSAPPLPPPQSAPPPTSGSTTPPPVFIIIHGRDSVPPQTSIIALSASQTTPDFLVSWQGQDNVRDGSVVFSIQYQVNSADWLDWINDSAETGATFTGENNNTYGFRSSGRDNEGNRSQYPAQAETSTYVNTRRPNPPQITSHTDGQTLTTTEIILAGAAEANNLITVTLPAGNTATTTADAVGAWSAAIVLSEGNNALTITAQEADGDVSDAIAINLTVNIIPTWQVVINEIAWMGTAADGDGEWLELYNNTEQDVDLTGWTLAGQDGTLTINLTGTIPGQSYFLLERTDDATVSDIAASQIYTGALNDEGEVLSLRDGSGNLVDKVGSAGLHWYAGDNEAKKTMERKDPQASGVQPDNWGSNDGSLLAGKDMLADNLLATAKSLNSVNTTMPRPVTDLTAPSGEVAAAAAVLRWSSPVNANLGEGASYDLRYLSGGNCPINEDNFAQATQAEAEPAPTALVGESVSLTVNGLQPGTTYCFALKTNNGRQWSALSNAAPIITPGLESVDQAQTLFNTNAFWGWNGRRSWQAIGQTFIPVKPTLTGFNFRLCRTGTQTALRAYLCAGEPMLGYASHCANGIPLWSKEYTLAETQTLLPSCAVSANEPPVVNFSFDPVALAPGSIYSLVFRGHNFNFGESFISGYQADTNPYLGGQMWYSIRQTTGNTFVATSTFAALHDWYFETFGR